MSTCAGLWACLLLLLLATSVQSEDREPMPSQTGTRSIDIPFDGPGQLLMVASRGPDRPPNHVLLLASRAGTTQFSFAEPLTARWRSPVEIIASRSGPRASDVIVRLDRAGRTLEVLSKADLAYPRPSPDGRRVAVAHFEDTPEKRGIGSTEVRDLDEGFKLVASLSHRDLDTLTGTVVWSPDGKQLAVDLASDEAGGRVKARLGVVSLETDVVRRLYDSPEDRELDDGGVIPMFWTKSGLYVRSQRGVLRCDPEGKGCTVVYNPGLARRAVDGAPFGSDEALILVQDLHADALEGRAKEIHRLDLNTGKGGLWYRLPDDVFVSMIDWTTDAP